LDRMQFEPRPLSHGGTMQLGQAGFLALSSAYSPRLPEYSVAWLRLSSLITVAGQRRNFTFFPIIPPDAMTRPMEHLNE
jgi:hypothetical protein